MQPAPRILHQAHASPRFTTSSGPPKTVQRVKIYVRHFTVALGICGATGRRLEPRRLQEFAVLIFGCATLGEYERGSVRMCN
jgi:hypothetical protein